MALTSEEKRIFEKKKQAFVREAEKKMKGAQSSMHAEDRVFVKLNSRLQEARRSVTKLTKDVARQKKIVASRENIFNRALVQLKRIKNMSLGAVSRA